MHIKLTLISLWLGLHPRITGELITLPIPQPIAVALPQTRYIGAPLAPPDPLTCRFKPPYNIDFPQRQGCRINTDLAVCRPIRSRHACRSCLKSTQCACFCILVVQQGWQHDVYGTVVIDHKNRSVHFRRCGRELVFTN